MPDRSDKVKRLYEEADEYELPYISKSRVKSWLENKEHWRLKYLEGIEVSETGPMVRGSRIHEAIENFYGNVLEEDEPYGLIAEPARAFGKDRTLWADFISPYLSNFLVWEHERRSAVDDVQDYLPVAIEEEFWSEGLTGVEGEPGWMGLADVVLPAASFPEVSHDDGVVVVDFKTGSVPDKQYRSPGIYTELEYYVMLFEQEYDVTAAAAYYPRENETIVQPDREEYRRDVLDAVTEMVQAANTYGGDEKFEINEGPLCQWGTEDGQKSSFYGVCTQCTWGIPANNREEFEGFIEDGRNDYEIAEVMGCSPDAVRYWKHKLDLA